MSLLDTRWHLAMSRADRRRWRSAATLTDLGALTEDWLTGAIASHPQVVPGYGPDEETADLVDALVALNRAGFVTIASQPGRYPAHGSDGAVWTQYPAVQGFIVVDNPLLGTLLEQAEREDWQALVYDVNPADAAGIAVTFRGNDPVTRFGAPLRERDLHEIWRGFPGAAEACARAVQLTLVNPNGWQFDSMWPRLLGLAEASLGDGRICRRCNCTTDRACEAGCWWVEPDLCSACRSQESEDHWDLDWDGDDGQECANCGAPFFHGGGPFCTEACEIASQPTDDDPEDQDVVEPEHTRSDEDPWAQSAPAGWAPGEEPPF